MNKLPLNIIISFSLVIFLCCIFSCKSNNESGNKKTYKGKPEIEFTETTHDFGTIKEGEIVECNFYFKNSGTAPLIIKDVIPDCGCTAPEYDKKEILPGQESKIKVVFNSEGFMNNVYKTIDVETNTKEPIYELVLTAFIETDKSLN
jgi:hypothetical protein